VVAVAVVGLCEGASRLAEHRFDVLIGPFEIDVVPEVLGFDPQHEIGHLDLTTYANDGGYNGVFRAKKRTPRSLRVAVLGDSFTFGWGVQADQAWPALLEEALGKKVEPTGLGVEVLNFGVPGYNTWLQLLHWREVVVDYKPDVVLLGYYSNDAVIDRRVPNVYKVCSLPGPFAGGLLASALERSALIRVAHDLFWIAKDGSPLPPWEGKDVLVDDHYGFRCSLHWAEQLADEVTSTGSAFAVVQLPHMDGLDDPGDPEREAQERLQTALEARSIRTDNLYPRLAGGDPAALNNADAHPNVEGNRAILSALMPTTGNWLLSTSKVALPPEPEAQEL